LLAPPARPKNAAKHKTMHNDKVMHADAMKGDTMQK